MAPRILRAQNALEFMVTYGWAILVLMVVLAALYSIGIFNGLIGSQSLCSFPANLGCQGAALSSSGVVMLNIQQSTGDTVNVVSIACNNNQGTNPLATISPPQTIPVGANATFYVQCYQNGAKFSGGVGTSYKGFVVVNYTDLANGFTYTVTGSLIESVSSTAAFVQSGACAGGTNTISSGSALQVIVPSGCGNVIMALSGGGGGGAGSAPGGAGGYISGTYAVSPGGSLYVWVGGGGVGGGAATGGSPGGGSGYTGEGGGGGCSAVSASSSLSNPSVIIVAAGGGGSGGYSGNGGPGGGTSGAAGSTGSSGDQGAGGTQSGGGAGSLGAGSGTAYSGGNAANGGGGGGGCGYYGGGGGSAAYGFPGGGGGGSSWNSISVTSVTNSQGGGGSAGAATGGNGGTGSVALTWST